MRSYTICLTENEVVLRLENILKGMLLSGKTRKNIFNKIPKIEKEFNITKLSAEPIDTFDELVDSVKRKLDKSLREHIPNMQINPIELKTILNKRETVNNMDDFLIDSLNKSKQIAKMENKQWNTYTITMILWV